MARFSTIVFTFLGLLLTVALNCSGGDVNSGDGGPDGDGDADMDVDADSDSDSDADADPCPGGCPGEMICHEGECVDPVELCVGVECNPGERCYLGRCVPEDDPCVGVECPEGAVCRDGECIEGEADVDEDGFMARDDCNDGDPEIHPGAEERCNGEDDDCDDAIDETFDSDGDGFPGCEASPPELLDCDDEDAWIYPGSAERCNGLDDDCDEEVDEDDPGGGEACGESTGGCEPGINHCVEGELQCVGAIGARDETCNGEDDDCNGTPDDGAAAESCRGLPHGIVDCVRGGCHLVGCEDGWAHLNADEADGCETQIDPYPDTCGGAHDLGAIADDGSAFDVRGTIAPAGDVDWVTFRANDADDAGCDTFHLRIQFATNPGDAYAMEVRRGGCRSEPECGAASLANYEFYTDFRGDIEGEIRGECPCTGSPGAPGANECEDVSALYVVRIFRTDGGTSADQYHLRISNP